MSKDLNIYVEVFAAEAKAAAQKLDEKYQKDPKSVGRLHGMVLSIKDVICYQNHSVTAGSKILEGFVTQYTATALQRLLDEDVIVIGRVNCDQFAMGSGNENSYYGDLPGEMGAGLPVSDLGTGRTAKDILSSICIAQKTRKKLHYRCWFYT
mgnify:CR=1 FL=1